MRRGLTTNCSRRRGPIVRSIDRSSQSRQHRLLRLRDYADALAGIAAAHTAALDRSIILAHDEPHRFRRLQAKVSTLRLLLADEATPIGWFARVAGIRVWFSESASELGAAMVTDRPDAPLLHDRFALIGAHASGCVRFLPLC